MKSIKRYALFTWSKYYPEGGWNDLKNTFETPEDAQQSADDFVEAEQCLIGYQIVDLDTGKIISHRRIG